MPRGQRRVKHPSRAALGWEEAEPGPGGHRREQEGTGRLAGSKSAFSSGRCGQFPS